MDKCIYLNCTIVMITKSHSFKIDEVCVDSSFESNRLEWSSSVDWLFPGLVVEVAVMDVPPAPPTRYPLRFGMARSNAWAHANAQIESSTCACCCRSSSNRSSSLSEAAEKVTVDPDAMSRAGKTSVPVTFEGDSLTSSAWLDTLRVEALLEARRSVLAACESDFWAVSNASFQTPSKISNTANKNPNVTRTTRLKTSLMWWLL